MEKQIVGMFTAITFNDEVYEFIVNDNHTIDCPKLNLESSVNYHLEDIDTLKSLGYLKNNNLSK